MDEYIIVNEQVLKCIEAASQVAGWLQYYIMLASENQKHPYPCSFCYEKL
jgi:hypothetical protein